MKKLGTAVAQLVEALRYKPEGRWFDSRWCLWNSGPIMALGFDVLLTVYLSIILAINQLNAQNLLL